MARAQIVEDAEQLKNDPIGCLKGYREACIEIRDTHKFAVYRL